LLSNTPITGILDLTNNLLIQQVQANNVALSAMPNLTNNSSLTNIGLSNCGLTGVLNLTNNTNLTGIDISNNSITSIAGFTNTNMSNGLFNNNKLPISTVNTILTHIDSKNLTGVYSLSTQFQNPLAPPSGAGITAKNALISRGYMLSTD
jgi:hypothetical protein